jgi:hypothetical protein
LPPPPDTQAESATTIAQVDARRRIMENCMGAAFRHVSKTSVPTTGTGWSACGRIGKNSCLTCRSPERGGRRGGRGEKRTRHGGHHLQEHAAVSDVQLSQTSVHSRKRPGS